jgi:hypothetical protein
MTIDNLRRRALDTAAQRLVHLNHILLRNEHNSSVYLFLPEAHNVLEELLVLGSFLGALFC